MTIALDGTPLTEPTGGIARYTWELARSLAEMHPGDQYWLLSDQTFAMPMDRPPNLHAGSRPHSAIDKRWWLWGLQQEMLRRGVELFHGTDFSIPYIPRGRPSVMTVHDISPWVAAPWAGGSERVRTRTPLLLRLGLAKMVITPSEAVRAEVIERFELGPQLVVAVPLAARELFRPMETAPAKPYFLFVGTLEERKNIGGLVEAWRTSRNETQAELWLVGRAREGFQLPDVDGLRHLTHVPDSDLPGLYSGAAAFVYPSHYEGFGLPVLEAMQCGCPVITSRDAAITEVSRNAAIHIDAEDSGALANAMVSLMNSPRLRERMRDDGLERARHYSWRETARRTKEVYAAAVQH